MNLISTWTIFIFEIRRSLRNTPSSFVAPVLTTGLYFVVFGQALGDQIDTIEGVKYGRFIVPGILMLAVMTQSIANASFGIYLPKFTGTIFELLSAPVNLFEIIIGYVAASTVRSLIIGFVVIITANHFMPLNVSHPGFMIVFLIVTCLSFSLIGFFFGLIANSFEQIQLIPLLIISPLVFLGGSFYSISMLSPFWQKVSVFNPIFYLISGLKWTFFGRADVPFEYSVVALTLFLILSVFMIWVIFRTGFGLRS